MTHGLAQDPNRFIADDHAVEVVRVYYHGYQHSSMSMVRTFTGPHFDSLGRVDGVDPSPNEFAASDLLAVETLSCRYLRCSQRGSLKA